MELTRAWQLLILILVCICICICMCDTASADKHCCLCEILSVNTSQCWNILTESSWKSAGTYNVCVYVYCGSVGVCWCWCWWWPDRSYIFRLVTNTDICPARHSLARGPPGYIEHHQASLWTPEAEIGTMGTMNGQMDWCYADDILWDSGCSGAHFTLHTLFTLITHLGIVATS